MVKYVLKRLLYNIPVLLGVAFLVFSIMALMPGDPASTILGTGATKEAIETMNHELGFDQPFFTRFFNYIGGVVFRLDFGISYSSGHPVVDELAVRFPYTLMLSLYTIVISTFIGTLIGVFSAIKQYSLMDGITTVAALVLASMPMFWVGMLLIQIFAEKLGWLPTSGVEGWYSFLLPMGAMCFQGIANMLRMTRTQMLETIRQDYVRTARGKGAPERKVIWKHALKNALLPLITSQAVYFGQILGGSVVVETVFSIPGLGTYIITGIRDHDVPVVLSSMLLIALVSCLLMLVVDIVYAFIDPRIKAKYANAK